MTRQVAALLLGLSPAVAVAQVAYPPRPDRYDAQVRYRIRGDRDSRVVQFRALQEFLKGKGFDAAPADDDDLAIFDPAAEFTRGTVPGGTAHRLTDDPRVATVLLAPAGTTPGDPARPTEVRLTLAGGLAAAEQRKLHAQLSGHLRLVGFREAVGYDTAGGTLLRGRLPAGNLGSLLRDPRSQPTGWFLPAVSPAELPTPLANVRPVRVVEVLPDLPTATALPAPAEPPAKLTAGVATVLADMANAGRPLRVDAVLTDPPGDGWPDLRDRLRRLDGAAIDGLVGPVLSVSLAKASDVARLADLPEVRTVRLPVSATDTTAPARPPDLGGTGVFDLHARGYRGDGLRVVVVGAGFDPAGLPAGTPVIDLTAELDPDLNPRPGPAVNASPAAAAVRAAAPAAGVVAVRVDPAALHQVGTLAAAAAGRSAFSEAMQTRSFEFARRAEELASRRDRLTDEYRRALTNLGDEPAAADRRKVVQAAFDKLTSDERALRQAVGRFNTLKAALDGLRGTAVVVNTLVWDAGFPQDGLSTLSKQIEELYTPAPAASALARLKRPPTPVWVQAASPAVGGVWAGPFLDADADGVLDFAPAETPVPAGRWTRTLNFLGTASGDALPAGLRLRLVAQWREPLYPDGLPAPEPQVPFAVRLLRQLDPSGKGVATDEFAEVARSAGPPVRLLRTAGGAAFEQVLDVTLPAEGVYAVAVDGRPYQDPLAAQRREGEIFPRLVATGDTARPVFRTFGTAAAGVGVPGDSAGAVTVGRAVGSLGAAGPGVALRAKPDVLAGGGGNAEAAGTIGGAAASLLSAGVRVQALLRAVERSAGQPLQLPPDWLATLPPRPWIGAGVASP
jgi:hypothetical protein